MDDFLKFIDKKAASFPMHVEILYDKTCDWRIYIYKKGCAKDYPKSKCNGEDAVICNAQSGDIELAFAMAQCEVKRWFSDNDEGY